MESEKILLKEEKILFETFVLGGLMGTAFGFMLCAFIYPYL